MFKQHSYSKLNKDSGKCLRSLLQILAHKVGKKGNDHKYALTLFQLKFSKRFFHLSLYHLLPDRHCLV